MYGSVVNYDFNIWELPDLKCDVGRTDGNESVENNQLKVERNRTIDKMN